MQSSATLQILCKNITDLFGFTRFQIHLNHVISGTNNGAEHSGHHQYDQSKADLPLYRTLQGL
tara:strand:- start:88 stop:276 length:189 start_codon:yes stop_codon:yes gene_type:complete